MLDLRRYGEIRADDGAPFAKRGGVAEVNGVVLERIPEDHQHVSIGRFDATVDLIATKTDRLCDHGLHPVLDGRVESGLLAGSYTDVGHFEDHICPGAASRGAGVFSRRLGVASNACIPRDPDAHPASSDRDRRGPVGSGVGRACRQLRRGANAAAEGTGISLAIVKNGALVVAKGYGESNIEHHVPVTPETIFQSGSVGKQFASAAVMLMVEEGRLALEDSITQYLPDAPASWKPIRVRHLLTHTSGIPDYAVDTFDYRHDATEEQLTKMAYALQLQFVPGAKYEYSNTGYLLLGVIIHKVSGQFYGDLLAERVFRPLGMSTARVISEADIVPHRAAGYQLVDGQVKNQDWVAPSLNTTADGALYLSALDMVAWDKGLRAGAILKPDSWKQVYTPVRLNSGEGLSVRFRLVGQQAGRRAAVLAWRILAGLQGLHRAIPGRGPDDHPVRKPGGHRDGEGGRRGGGHHRPGACTTRGDLVGRAIAFRMARSPSPGRWCSCRRDLWWRGRRNP
jgi:CubicO group peptidase (beta-lactamase class C family)